MVISGLVLALCCGRDGKLSSLHRHLVNHYPQLCLATGQQPDRPISRAQLPLLLAKVNGNLLADLLFTWFGLVLTPAHKRWFAVDGKELRGSIKPAHKRGEACVSVLDHASSQVVGQAYYQGNKESERPTTRQLLNDRGLYHQQLSLDALHLNPLTVNAIQGAGGVYMIGLKGNQAKLYQHCLALSLVEKAAYERSDEAQRGHGRIEQRSYRCFRVDSSALAQRWQASGLSWVIAVKRLEYTLAGEKMSETTSYFVSNAQVVDQKQANALFDAIRQHWLIEVMHHRRDVTLSEDKLRTGDGVISRLMSSLRALVINLLGKTKPVNMTAQIEGFADKFHTLTQFMTQQMIL